MKISKLKLITAITTMLSFSLILINCKTKEPQPSPIIDSFTPVSAIVGGQVTIAGHNFKEDISSNTINFNGIDAIINSASTTEIITNVPAGATSGKITVTVNNQTAISDTDFTVLVPQTIASFAPLQELQAPV